MKSILGIFLIVFLLVSFSKIQINSPNDLKAKFHQTGKTELETGYANFGKIPYGTTIYGRVYFFPNNPRGCNRFENVPLDKEGDQRNDVNAIVIVERGYCSFVKKARNIQELGGKMALIVNNNPIINPESVVIGDDGTGSSIVIPTVLIGHREGRIIINYLNESDSLVDKNKKAQVSISVNFNMENPDDRVEYDIWYVPTQNTSYQFISKFHQYNKHLGKNVLMTPRIVLWSCEQCGSEWDEFCFCGHKYCSAPDASQIHNGREIILEGIRQKCIYNLTFEDNQGEKWWDYIDYLKSYCPKTYDEECSYKAILSIGLIAKDVDKCINDSFLNNKMNNPMLEEDLQKWNLIHGIFYPSIIINNQVFKGQLEAHNVFNGICAGFNVTPSECDISFLTTNFFSARNIFLILVFVLLLNFIAFYIYRKHVRRELKEEMQLQITSVMTQYFALADSNKNKKSEA